MPLLTPGRRECLQKMKSGATLGAGVGSAAGLLFGAYEASQIRSIPMSQVSEITTTMFVFQGSFSYGTSSI